VRWPELILWPALARRAKRFERRIILSHPLLKFDDLLYVERDVLQDDAVEDEPRISRFTKSLVRASLAPCRSRPTQRVLRGAGNNSKMRR